MGDGLSYTTFNITRTGDEVAQLYLHEPVATLSQPLRSCAASSGHPRAAQSKTVTFELGADDVGYQDNAGRFLVEPGRIELSAGDSAHATRQSSVTLRCYAGRT